MYEEYDRKVDEFFDQEINYGVSLGEIISYINKNMDIDLHQRDENNKGRHIHVVKYINKNYRTLKSWRELYTTFLQQRHGGSSFGNKCSSAKITNLKFNHLKDNSYILANNDKSALVRLLFEIKEDIDELVNCDIVRNTSGYHVLKLLHDHGQKDIDDIMNSLGYAKRSFESPVSRCRTKMNENMIQLRNITNNGSSDDNTPLLQTMWGKYRIHPDFADIFDYIDEIEDDIRTWEHRINWILPCKKIKIS